MDMRIKILCIKILRELERRDKARRRKDREFAKKRKQNKNQPLPRKSQRTKCFPYSVEQIKLSIVGDYVSYDSEDKYVDAVTVLVSIKLISLKDLGLGKNYEEMELEELGHKLSKQRKDKIMEELDRKEKELKDSEFRTPIIDQSKKAGGHIIELNASGEGNTVNIKTKTEPKKSSWQKLITPITWLVGLFKG